MNRDMTKRKSVPLEVQRAVLAEAGYRCAVPTCRTILAIDLHHIIEVKDDGPNEVWNLIALCPNCHALHTRGDITKDAIDVYKGILVSLNAAFDREAINNLMFLSSLAPNTLRITGDGVLKFSSLIGSGLADFELKSQNGPLLLYEVRLTLKGKKIISAWQSGDRTAVLDALK